MLDPLHNNVIQNRMMCSSSQAEGLLIRNPLSYSLRRENNGDRLQVRPKLRNGLGGPRDAKCAKQLWVRASGVLYWRTHFFGSREPIGMIRLYHLVTF